MSPDLTEGESKKFKLELTDWRAGVAIVVLLAWLVSPLILGAALLLR